ncbi:MMPL family transporter [Streptomyces sp. ISL-96]|uniref:MMPL family transporter n=1 Tax=Streptomyces sp. ISL-96 TaxID=2819191 RepID=UPI001BE981D7|nr:MMPL family transporter [Streptomyces sp. ISL-96]MBT2491910.1 MMPL family transporter [Streptomyces sp. ISL-96]
MNQLAGARRRPLVERVTRWSVHNRKRAAFGWLGLVVLIIALGAGLGSTSLDEHAPGETGRAQKMLDDAAVFSPPQENVLIEAKSGDPAYAQNPQMQAAAKDVAEALRGLGKDETGAAWASDIVSPTDSAEAARNLVSEDGRSLLVRFSVTGYSMEPMEKAVTEQATSHPEVAIAQTGKVSVSQAIDKIQDDDFLRAEILSIPLTVIILAVVFGSLISAGLPVLISLVSVVAAMGFLTFFGNWIAIGDSTPSVVLLIGMAVGVDYSLFYLRRAREERAAGHDNDTALIIAGRTSGKAVVVSGLTVMVALAGLFFTGIETFTGMTVGTISVVGIAMIGAVTALPATLAWLGERVDRWKVPWLGVRRTAVKDSRVWGAVVRQVVKAPVVWAVVGALALALLAVPAAGMKLSDPDLKHRMPTDVPALQALERVEKAFPVDTQPAEIVVRGSDLNGAEVKAGIAELKQQVADSGGKLKEPVEASLISGGKLMVVRVPLAGDGKNAVSTAALKELRDTALPASLGKVDGLEFAVAGDTAKQEDFNSALDNSAPWVFGFVIILAFVLLAAAFRSLIIPVVSIILNLLSIGAAYGVLTLVFQDGHLASVLDFRSYGAVVSWLPLFMFVTLFGLSMDYHVFILSRVREYRGRGLSTKQAVVEGITKSAGVVTSAAAVMIAVFSVFGTLSAIDFKMVGVGLATAVLIDATIVRGVLLPAMLTMFGDATWKMPRWLQWLPGISLEGADEPVAGRDEQDGLIPAPRPAAVEHGQADPVEVRR